MIDRTLESVDMAFNMERKARRFHDQELIGDAGFCYKRAAELYHVSGQKELSKYCLRMSDHLQRKGETK